MAKPMFEQKEVPTHVIQADYQTDQGHVQRTIFVYAKDNIDDVMARAWKDTAIRARVYRISADLKHEVKPTAKAGVWA